MTDRSVSIAEARAKLSGLIREAEEGEAVQITRWGAPVAVLVSAARYQKLAHGRPPFGVALDTFLEGIELAKVGLEEGEFLGLRERGPGRGAPW
jgi:prevent-host-death family protein